ncbi:MAG: 3-dehydroquinate synthase [Bdellovibrionales bacterium]|nr:3-dehydroquinate synthase [Bdellovibrionales bacterium]
MKLKSNGKKEFRTQVKLGARSYSVFVGPGVTNRLDQVLRQLRSPAGCIYSQRGILLADERLTRPAQKVLAVLRKSGWQMDVIKVAAGESLKDFQSILPLYGELLKLGIDRSSTVFVLGGGTLGDAGGFLASTYLRGLRWVGIPTTLLAQVDSSIGGKTAVNHSLGKNLIGTFHQPALVVCDTNFLKTLSLREIISGLGEVIKYALTYDKELFVYLNKQWRAVLDSDSKVLSKLVHESLSWKAKVVAADEWDRKGRREILNFGHTFGHALEAVTNYEVFQHGEAVIWGMRFATCLSETRGHLSLKQAKKIRAFLNMIEVPSLPKHIGFDELTQAMAKDKKKQEGRIRFVLLKRLGRAVLDVNVTGDDLKAAYKRLLTGGHHAEES